MERSGTRVSLNALVLCLLVVCFLWPLIAFDFLSSIQGLLHATV